MKKISSSASLGRVAYEHDVRNSKDMKNVRYEASPNNKILIDKLRDEPGSGVERIYSYTDKKYQKYVDEYNKGKKPCRQIKNGYSEHFNKHQLNAMAAGRPTTQIAYEMVIQMGNHESIGQDFFESWVKREETKVKGLYKDFVYVYQKTLEQIQERFKHLDILYAGIHVDEFNGTPHMHVIFQPNGEGYKQGLNHQVSLSRALANDGFARTEKRSKEEYQLSRAFKVIQEEIMPEIIESRGYEWYNDGHTKGRGHIDSREYPAAISTAIEQSKEELEALSVNLADTDIKLHDAQEKLHKTQDALNDSIELLTRVDNFKKDIVKAPLLLDATRNKVEEFISLNDKIQENIDLI